MSFILLYLGLPLMVLMLFQNMLIFFVLWYPFVHKILVFFYVFLS